MNHEDGGTGAGEEAGSGAEESSAEALARAERDVRERRGEAERGAATGLPALAGALHRPCLLYTS
uniref:hypothetical protein n=1 Tax=Streptomyces sp. t99 TaxID=1828172 RepID=UPI001C54D13B